MWTVPGFPNRVLPVLMFLLACSSKSGPGIINLLDHISHEETNPPWRVVLLLRGSGATLKPAENLGVVSGGMTTDRQSQPSITRLRPTVRGGGLLVIHVGYRKAWEKGALLEARILQDGGMIRQTQHRLEGNSTTLRMKCEVSGEILLELSHRSDTHRPIPIKSVAVGETRCEECERDICKLELLLKSLSSSRISDTGVALPSSDRFLLSVDNCTRDGILLGAHDTLLISPPPTNVKGHLRFSYVGLEGQRDNQPVLMLEAQGADGWRMVGEWGVRGHGKWSDLAVPFERMRMSPSMLRFTLHGNAALVFVAEPVMIQDRRDHSGWNLVLIDLDTARADRFGSYGYVERPTSARLDSFLEEKGFVVFESAYSSAPHTLPATVRFMASRYRGASSNVVALQGSELLLAEILRSNGYYCAAFTGGGPLRTPGFSRGFHDFHWHAGLGKTEDTFPDAHEWLLNAPEPFFLFLHTFEPHRPYTRTVLASGLPRGRLLNPAEDGTFLPKGLSYMSELSKAESVYVQALYDGGIRVSTDAVADLFVLMESLGVWDNTVVIVLSDHGEEFWEHRNCFASHGHSLYDELLRVPFMMYYPGREHNLTVREAVSTVDLLPTVAELLHLEWTGEADGVSVLPLVQGKPVNRRVPIMGYIAGSESRWGGMCLYQNGMKYSETTRVSEIGSEERGRVLRREIRELYSIEADPGETQNLIDANHQIASAMMDTLRLAQLRALPPVGDGNDDETRTMSSITLRKQLVELGYLRGAK